MGNSLLGACSFHGIPTITKLQKDSMHDLVLTGGPWTQLEQTAIVNYCATDVIALEALLPRMLPRIMARPKGLGQALLRGRYMKAVARMEAPGIPQDVALLARLQAHWPELKRALVVEYGLEELFDDTTLKHDRLEVWAAQHRVPWPRTPTGRLETSEKVLRDLGKTYPETQPIVDLSYALGKLKLNKLAEAVGADCRNRTMLSPFRAKTGRNAPSNSKSIFGPAVWLRGLIKPAAGRALAYVDYSSQEIAIAAVLSGDPMLLADVQSGDPYMAFGRRTGLVPPDATRHSHHADRERFKVLLLGTNYGMWIRSLAGQAGIGEFEAAYLLRLLDRTYTVFSRWAEAETSSAQLRGWQRTKSGWHRWLTAKDTANSVRNWPVQSLGAEMLRLACCLATERGITVDMPVHDALLVGSTADAIDETVAATRAAMAEASRLVLDGFEIATDAKVVRYPDRYMDGREGAELMWNRVNALLGPETRIEGVLVEDTVSIS